MMVVGIISGTPTGGKWKKLFILIPARIFDLKIPFACLQKTFMYFFRLTGGNFSIIIDNR